MTDGGVARSITILLVEDNPLDAKATIKAAEQLSIANTINVVTDGEAAFEYLRNPDMDRPDLILLDLNLPGLDGRDVLAEIKSDVDLRRIPVVVLTTSADEADIFASYDLGANAYVTKPLGLDQWLQVVATIEGFWLSLAKLPPR